MPNDLHAKHLTGIEEKIEFSLHLFREIFLCIVKTQFIYANKVSFDDGKQIFSLTKLMFFPVIYPLVATHPSWDGDKTCVNYNFL
jgi:hypothetical protein